MFDAAVHSNPDISRIQKFSYLKSLMEGTAWEAIQGLALTAEGYQEAIDILTKRFGDKQKIIDKHMNLLLNTERITSSGNVSALRKQYDSIEANIRALKALGVNVASYGSLLVSVLVQKLPSDLKLIVGRELTGGWQLPEIMKVLNRELEARERTTITPVEGLVSQRTHEVVRRKSEKPSMVALFTDGQVNRRECPATCCYCQHEHSPESCPIVIRIDEHAKIQWPLLCLS